MALRNNYSNIDLLRFKKFADKNTGLKPIELIKKFNEEYPELSEKQKLANLYAALGMNGDYKELMGTDIPESERWQNVDTSQDQALNVADVIARYSLPEQMEYDIAKLLELKIKLSEKHENELGLTREEYEEYEQLDKWFNGL